jgi:hypothetical protein
MEVTDAGISMDMSAVLSNAKSPMVKSPLPAAKVTDVRSAHRKNALVPMEVTDAGISMEVRPDTANVLTPMVASWIPAANVTIVRSEQS